MMTIIVVLVAFAVLSFIVAEFGLNGFCGLDITSLFFVSPSDLLHTAEMEEMELAFYRNTVHQAMNETIEQQLDEVRAMFTVKGNRPRGTARLLNV